jgi:hypothetical protein
MLMHRLHTVAWSLGPNSGIAITDSVLLQAVEQLDALIAVTYASPEGQSSYIRSRDPLIVSCNCAWFER